jgi:Kdo2-lipid IVA lauroyltransferase/acyltransferase
VVVDLLLTLLVRAFQQTIRVLPESAAAGLGSFLGRCAYHVLRDRRHVARRNVRRIFPAMSRRQVDQIVLSCLQKLGINFMEILRFPYLKKEEYTERFALRGIEHARGALAEGRGILALVFHYANWEIMGVASYILQNEVVTLARPLKHRDRLNAFLNQLRTATGLTVIPNRDTAKDVIRLLRENRIVALLGDQREKRSKAVWVEFFSEKVPTSKGVVMLGMKTGVPVIPVYAVREGFLRYTIVFNRPLEIERKGAPVDELIYRNARRVNAFLEGLVTANPDEWLLVHRRWGSKRTS